jgi:hypothetical protein
MVKDPPFMKLEESRLSEHGQERSGTMAMSRARFDTATRTGPEVLIRGKTWCSWVSPFS